jgi:uncharacterized protein YjbI with pentapeptide repeats
MIEKNKSKEEIEKISVEEKNKKIRIKAYEIDKERQSRGWVSQEDWDKAVEEIEKTDNPFLYKVKQIRNWADLKDKKLWDFMQLLVTPVLLSILAGGLQDCSKRNEQQASENRDRQVRLTKYLDEMSALLEKNLLKSKPSTLKEKITDPILASAQAKTVVALTSLDSTRQNSVLQFLDSSTLNGLDGERGLLFRAKMGKAKLNGADLTKAKMIQAFLQHSNLTNADLTGADLRSVDLENANLTKATLFESDLRRAELEGATLVEANLALADLTGANVKIADMKGAKLDRSILLGVNLYEVKNLTEEQLGIDVKTPVQKQDEIRKSPLLCHVKLPKRIQSKIPPELLKSYTDRNCNDLQKIVSIRYSNTYNRMYEKLLSINNKIILDKDKEKDKKEFNEKFAQATIDRPECVILIPGAEYKSNCNEIFKLSPLDFK